MTGHGEKAAVATDLRKACSDSVAKSTLVQVAPIPVLIFVKLSVLIWSMPFETLCFLWLLNSMIITTAAAVHYNQELSHSLSSLDN